MNAINYSYQALVWLQASKKILTVFRRTANCYSAACRRRSQRGRLSRRIKIVKWFDMPSSGVIHVIDDDVQVREALCALLESVGYNVTSYKSAKDFLEDKLPFSWKISFLTNLLDRARRQTARHRRARISGVSEDVGIPVILMRHTYVGKRYEVRRSTSSRSRLRTRSYSMR